MSNKWSKTFWADLAERVGTTAIGALLAVAAGSTTGAIPNDPAVWWSVVGVPTVVSLLKGLLANMASPESGPSLLPAPPAPEVPAAGGIKGEAGPELPVTLSASPGTKLTAVKKTAAKKAAPPKSGD